MSKRKLSNMAMQSLTSGAVAVMLYSITGWNAGVVVLIVLSLSLVIRYNAQRRDAGAN